MGLTTTARTPDGTGSGWADTGGSAGFDVMGAARIACRKAKLSRGARHLEPGRYQVVLEPAALADLIGYMQGALNARAVDEGRSPFSKKVGEKVAGRLTLSSDPWSPLAPLTGLTRDGVFLVEQGKIVGPVQNFRFNQSVPQMFQDADAYGAPVTIGGNSWLPLAAPALRCSSFHMASRSDAV